VISQDQNAACLILAQEAGSVPDWEDYAAYCRLRERGLRNQAFSRLESFIDRATKWSFQTQREFVLWLCKEMDSIKDADYGPYPTPLRTRLFAPFFDEWLRREPNNDEAYVLCARHLGEPRFYQRALEINPKNQRARIALAEECIYDTWYATHHFPHFFIGDEVKTTKTVQQARSHISSIEDPERQRQLLNELADLEQLLNDWIAFKQQGADDFQAWCADRGHHYSWVLGYYWK
jgi:hypothetical protein